MIARFLSRISIGAFDECWEFQGCNNNNYGHKYFKCKYCHTVYAHVVAYRLFIGKIPKRHGKEKLQVCHKCDNPPCCNPNHLFLGTSDDNSKDRVKKGRSDYTHAAKGEDQGFSKLTKEDVHKIRKLYKYKGYTHRRLGYKFGVTHQNISAILNNQSWKGEE
jgi:hypothetical protein